MTAIAHGKGGRLWIGTYAAVFGYDGDDFTLLDATNLRRSGRTGALHVRSIFEDSQGNLWIGNNGLGVLLYDGNTATDFSEDMGLVALGSLRSGGEASPRGTLEHVFAIAEDDSGNIWFGDRDTGTWKHDGQSMTNYGIADGLPTLSIWDIHKDRHGTILVALDNGVVCRFLNGAFEPVFPTRQSADQ